jgi:hypothetical protein
MDWPPKSNKSEQMEEMLTVFAGHEGNIFKRADCAMCLKTDLLPENFRNEGSIREFGISRLCQACQDKVFGVD